MGLKDAIQSAVTAAFSAVGDLKKSATLVKNNSNPAYNPTTGVITASTTSYPFSYIQASYEREEIDGSNVLSTDLKMIVDRADMTVTPEMKDTITIGGVTWNIKNVIPDAADATWQIQARRA